jgi:Acetyltransferase (GNAT) domain
MIGLIGVNSFDRLLYMSHPDFWGAGYCTEALRWFLIHLFEEQPERLVLVAGVHDGNEQSLRVLLKCGFAAADSLASAIGASRKLGGSGNTSGGERIDAAGPSPAPDGYPGFSWFRFERPLDV